MTRPRVLIFRSTLLPPSETFIARQVEHLRRYEPVYVGLEEYGVGGLALGAASHNLNLTRQRARLVRLIRRSQKLQSVVAKWQPSLIHAHFGFDAVTIAPISRNLRVPLVATYHGNDVTGLSASGSPRSMLYRERLKKVLGRAALNLAVSDFVADQTVKLEPAASPTVHHIGIVVPPHPETRTRPNPRILFTGRLVEKKGVEDLFKAVALLPSILRGVEVIIVGTGPLLGELQAIASKARIDAAFLGHLSHDDVYRQMELATIFCGPSRTAANGDSEGFGLVFLEAAAHGLPVVSYRHGGVPSAVVDGETGLLAEEGDVQGLASALEYLLVHADAATRMGSAGRKRVEEEFDISIQTSRLESLYDHVLLDTKL